MRHSECGQSVLGRTRRIRLGNGGRCQLIGDMSGVCPGYVRGMSARREELRREEKRRVEKRGEELRREERGVLSDGLSNISRGTQRMVICLGRGTKARCGCDAPGAGALVGTELGRKFAVSTFGAIVSAGYSR